MKLDELIKTPSDGDINSGLSACTQSTMISVFGKPGKLSKDCSDVTSAKIKKYLITASVGPFKVTGLKPAVQDLIEIFKEIKKENPDVYAQIKTAGMLCCRAVRKPDGTSSTTNWSNHSFAVAIDLYFGKQIDEQGDGKTQRGLLEIYPYFHKRGWFWGAEFSNEDSMHFEVAEETIKRWVKEGRFK